MDGTRDRQSVHAFRRHEKSDPQSLKSASYLYQEKELLKKQFDKQAVHLQGFESVEKHFENFKGISPSTSDLITVKETTFARTQQNKTVDEDESVVSSTTNEAKIERSPPLCDSSSRHNFSPTSEGFVSHPLPGTRKTTETAAASSTTILDDDDERPQMQEASRRRREIRPGGARQDASQGSTKETQPSSTTQEDEAMQDKSSNPNGYYKSKGDFVKPSDVPTKHKSQRSTPQLTPGLKSSADVMGQTTDAGRLPQALFPGFPDQFYSKDGRYSFDPRSLQMSMAHNLNRSPILSDVSLIPMSPQQQVLSLGGTNQINPNACTDFHMSGFSSPTMSVLSQARNLSPRQSMQDIEKMNQSFYGSHFNMASVPPGSQAPMSGFPGAFPAHSMNHFAYYQFLQQQQKLLGMSMDKTDEFGRFPSPLCRSRARKRPLSISPAFSDTLDINAMIRTSPNSLLPYVNGAGLGHSRCSSAASGGSYGHLVSGGISPSGYLSGYNTPNLSSPPLQLFSRQMSIPGYMPGIPPPHTGHTTDKADPTVPNPFHGMNVAQRNYTGHPGFPVAGKNQTSSIDQNGTDNKNRTKHPQDLSNQSTPYNRTTTNTNGVSCGNANDDNETVYETNCQWENCSKEFDTQEQLVQHINNDHIHGDKKEFACHWKDCARDKRPFKAQYMLVVHMRRHTGEKPHKCTFKDCAKAYSRLENLKTHLRSHTGEKPYVCEFPSCTKAFSNASDRAKHQNRTHSNEKPYVCKITGCTKRYTDPSSLRKHVKTVHGPDAHVTKRMKAIREREEKKSEINVKQEPGVDKDKKKSESNQTRDNCHSATLKTVQHTSDSNPPGSMNPRSNQSSYTSGSDVTPQNSPRMTSQNNDSGVDVNVVGNDADSDGDIIVDENPLPDSTSGGLVLQARPRGDVRTSLISRHFSKKMATLSLAGASGEVESSFHDYPQRSVENAFSMNEKNTKQGGTEVSSTTLNSKLQRVKNYIMNNPVTKHRHSSLINHDRRDSGTVSDVSRKSSSASQYSRKSSQISNTGINVAGSYDPISLDSSRRSSSNSTAAAVKYSNGSNSNPPGLNPYDLHHLQSKFSEIAGLPPPTPINGDPYSMSVPTKQNEAHSQPTNQRAASFHNCLNTFLPTPPRDNLSRGEAARRRSEDLYVRSMKPPQTGDSLIHVNRRASDPVPKTNQIDPNKLPTVQKHGSWSNMAPLPSIQSRKNYINSPAQYEGFNHPMHRALQRSSSSGNFFANSSNNVTPSQHHHQANFSHQMYQPHASANNQVFMNSLNSDTMSRCQPGTFPNQSDYGTPISSASHAMSPALKSMQPPSPHPSEMMQLSPMGRQHPASTPPISYQNPIHPNNHPMKGHHGVQAHSMSSSSLQSEQQRFYTTSNPQMGPGAVYGDQHYPVQGYMNNQQLYEMHQNHLMHQPIDHSNYSRQFDDWNHYDPQVHPSYNQHTKPRFQNQHAPSHHPVPPSSISNSHSQNIIPNPNPPFSSEETLTPRPPSHSSASTSNRLRLTRLRHNPLADAQNPLGSGSYARPTPRVNYTPDAQIPDEFLQQEFIDSIPELQPDAINSGTQAASYMKMPADSTTGPDGDIGDDIDDVMSTTNTDVTLPPMSAFSSRLATPLINKPYSPHPLPGAVQHPGSNMAISSMSSMLSTLEEENKFLSMMPPQ